jgi:peptidoglycan/xylan/chitin deacetylase (PgdA/CDA1 family)
MKTVPILMYHSVSDHADKRYARWCVSPRKFELHMSVLADAGYQVFTVSELVDRIQAGLPSPGNCVALTFDDGLLDFKTDAAPILKRFGFPATLYVVAGLLGKTSTWLADLGEGMRPMLKECDLLPLVEQGIEIGGHSMTHPQLDILTAEAARYEIETSRLELERIIGQPVRSFAYPHGYASSTTRRLTREAGYTSAARVCHAVSTHGENPFGLSRLIISEEHHEAKLLSLLQAKGVPIAPPQTRIASVGWRAVRRVCKWGQQIKSSNSAALVGALAVNW